MRSLPPLPERTTIRFAPKSTSNTRSDTHSMTRKPLP
jgi:hypothetical protein